MDDMLENPFEIFENHAPMKNCSLKIKFTSSKAINGFCKEKTHLQEEEQSSEMTSYYGSLKMENQCLSVDEENKEDTHTASDESVNGGNLKIINKKITCPVCGKIFPSMKSLFGHMRLHPDRKWRGIKPPPTLSVSVSTMVKIDYLEENSPSTSGRSDFDSLQSLKGWVVTGKRGWKRCELEVAGGLLMLVNGNTNLSSKRSNEKSEFGNSEFQNKKAKSDKENENSRDGLNAKFVKMDSGLGIANGFEVENINVEELSLVDVRNQIQVDKSQEFNLSISKNKVGKHQCKICNKTYPTGQALGGHQRLHRPMPKAAPISSVSTSEQISKGSPTTSSISSLEKFSKESSVSSVSPLERIIRKFPVSSLVLLDEVSNKMDCNGMAFDLNEPAPLDECFQLV